MSDNQEFQGDENKMSPLYLGLTFFIAICVFYCAMLLITGFTSFSKKKEMEHYDDDYYRFNWNKPGELTKVNNRILSPEKLKNCHNCKYSEACHLTDDALPTCYKSLDRPSYDKENDMYRTNSY